MKKIKKVNESQSGILTGRVIKSTGSWYDIKTDNNQVVTCRIRGKFRIKGIKTTNPLAVGDLVDFIIEPKKQTGVVVHIHPRKNYLLRRAVNLSKQYQILAANIDQVLVTVTVTQPETSTFFIDRILVSAESYNIPAVILINKIDLLTHTELQKRKKEIRDIYTQAGYDVLEVSAKTQENIEQLKKVLKGKTSIFTGHSGTGKSSLINTVDPRLNLKTGDISQTHQQGKHTTTFAQMFEFEFGGHIIDTPGIRGFGIVDIKNNEIDHFFPEIFKYKTQCKFNDCKHINEPGCAVKPAVEEKKIPLSRYKSYLLLTEELQNDNNTTYR